MCVQVSRTLEKKLHVSFVGAPLSPPNRLDMPTLFVSSPPCQRGADPMNLGRRGLFFRSTSPLRDRHSSPVPRVLGGSWWGRRFLTIGVTLYSPVRALISTQRPLLQSLAGGFECIGSGHTWATTYAHGNTLHMLSSHPHSFHTKHVSCSTPCTPPRPG